MTHERDRQVFGAGGVGGGEREGGMIPVRAMFHVCMEL